MNSTDGKLIVCMQIVWHGKTLLNAVTALDKRAWYVCDTFERMRYVNLQTFNLKFLSDTYMPCRGLKIPI